RRGPGDGVRDVGNGHAHGRTRGGIDRRIGGGVGRRECAAGREDGGNHWGGGRGSRRLEDRRGGIASRTGRNSGRRKDRERGRLRLQRRALRGDGRGHAVGSGALPRLVREQLGAQRLRGRVLVVEAGRGQRRRRGRLCGPGLRREGLQVRDRHGGILRHRHGGDRDREGSCSFRGGRSI